ncbi:MAG TPA: glycogen debranching protein GlgX [Acidimicrobiales bacterium]|jgi:glycogen operon protein|nr:glycogen debranching protein GlgX [Acidimicrobiales bacterium]
MPEVWPGDPHPLGATWDVVGTNFSVFSSAATKVELCLFGDDGTGAEERLALLEADGYCWHGYVYGVGPGTRYGFRVHGPWDPARGQRCNPNKLLLDPYAKAVDGAVRWNPAMSPYDERSGDDTVRSDVDSASYMPKSVVVDRRFDWGGDRPPRTAWHQSVIYETHVKGLTALHPAVPPDQRGTYSGVAHPAIIDHLTSLGVTAVELLPIHQFIHDRRLAELDPPLRNYWGYNSICFLAPHNDYASGGATGVVHEFKTMVRALHGAGLEVILDVVFNHTAEGDHRGAMLSFRGLDNRRYYWLDPNDPRRYWDTTGCGNTIDAGEPFALQLIMDSLRYWVLDMHVDGFRFDLASTLARQVRQVDPRSAFFDLVQQDPVISRVKLIAEPWDLGEGGYQVGNFPPPWSEWNGKYRDSIRDYWRENQADLDDVGLRLTGSPDIYQPTGRRPWASVNFVTAHDGFTLRDLVSYNDKHNWANGEDNRDGTDDNRSWNCGVEGPTDDPEVLALRARQVRNFLATLLLSRGVPMLLGGDEMGRTQLGNNNAYCQDNEISWFHWDQTDEDLCSFTRQLLALRRGHPIFTGRRFFAGRPLRPQAGGDREIAWFKPDGREMDVADWTTGYARSFGTYLNGEEISDVDRHGRRLRDDSFYLLLNAWDQSLDFVLPEELSGVPWQAVIDTAGPPLGSYKAGDKVSLLGRHVIVLQG